MKNVKRLLSVLLILVLALSFAGCHKKNEIAVTIGEWEFTSAYYMCAFLQANSEAETLVTEKLSEEESQAEIDFTSKKVEGKKFTDWVKDKAIEYLKEIATYKTLCKENDLKIDDETKASLEANVSSYWSQYYYAMYEPNGVSQDTYTKFMLDTYYSELYFEYLYAADGKTPVASADVEKEFYDNYIIADYLEANFEQEATEEDKTALKEKLDGYVEKLNSGELTFEQVYNDYNGITETEAQEEHDHDHEHEESEEEVKEPKDKYAQLLGSADTSYANDNYDTIKEMAIGEAKLITVENTGYVLAVKQDIKADTYYLENLDMTVRHALKDKDFEKIIEKEAKKAKADINNYAVNQFKVKKIVKPEQ